MGIIDKLLMAPLAIVIIVISIQVRRYIFSGIWPVNCKYWIAALIICSAVNLLWFALCGYRRL